MRHTEFWARMHEVLGETYAPVWSRHSLRQPSGPPLPNPTKPITLVFLLKRVRCAAMGPPVE